MNTQTRGLMILKKPGDRKMKRTKSTEVRIGVAGMLALMLTGTFAVGVKTEAAGMTSMGNPLTVTSDADAGGPCPGSNCTLRQAIADAAAGDTIEFALSYPATITLTSGELAITKNLTIQGPGANTLTVRRANGPEFRIFNIGGTVAISDLTISNGKAIDSRGGGGLANFGTLTLTNVTVSGNNVVSRSGGGIMNFTGATLTLTNCVVSGNSAEDQGGGISSDGTLTLSHTTVTG